MFATARDQVPQAFQNHRILPRVATRTSTTPIPCVHTSSLCLSVCTYPPDFNVLQLSISVQMYKRFSFN